VLRFQAHSRRSWIEACDRRALSLKARIAILVSRHSECGNRCLR
jgi:hypothetical protein